MADDSGRCSVLVCRTCCRRTSCDLSLLPGACFVDCLGPCAYPNVVVVRPSRVGRQSGGRPLWLGLLVHPAAIAALTRWLGAGGPGVSAPPRVVVLHELAGPLRRVTAWR